MGYGEAILSTRCFLFDLDGTVYLGDRLLPGVEDLFSYLEDRDWPFYLLTNNSSRSREDYAARLAKFDLEIPQERIISSGMAAAIYLQKEKPGARIFLVGTPSLEEEFRAYGFHLVDSEPDYAVLGFDTTLTYRKIHQLADFVLAGVPYLATHPDINCPTPDGFMPDIGAMMAMVEAATGKPADIIIGKPFPPMVDAITTVTGFQPSQLTMVGDRLYTDIALGEAGVKTVLVLSGETGREDLRGAAHQPDLVCQDLADLLTLLRAEGQVR